MIGVPSQTKQRPSGRSGITLLELIIAVSIISIIAALLVGVATQAGEVARDARTRSLIGRLHTLVVERYEEYRTRRVELNMADRNGNGSPDWEDNFRLVPFHGINPDRALTPPEINAAGRLAARRELMKFEMPDRWSDIWGGPLTNPVQLPKFHSESIALRNTYLRELDRVGQHPNLLQNESAECLYLFVMNATGNGEAPSLFNQGDIGDTDGDGALEFLDGWGQPIGFLRWAPGFDSDAQWSVASLQRRFARPPNNTNLTPIAAVEDALFEDHDPFDVFRLDYPWDDFDDFDDSNDTLAIRGWRLVPLIFSIGSDAEAGIQLGSAGFVTYANPYADADPGTNGIVERLGQIAGDPEGYADNLHNHDVASLSTRR